MNRFCLLALSVLLPMAAAAQENPSWIRKNAISPDGKTVVFSYKGDLYTVPSTGGNALQITSNSAFDSDPLWTPDGKRIVFTSWREDSRDIYVTSPEGGVPKRLTNLPGNETLLAADGQGNVWFTWYDADVQSPGFDGFPGTQQLYRTDLEGKAPQLVTSLTMSALSINPQGDMLYEDYKGYEDPLRKHHTSSVTRDIWLYRPAVAGKVGPEGSFKKLSTFIGEDRNPVFAADGDTFYFLSEQDGKTSNVFRSSLSHPERQTQVTFYEKNPVRFLSVASDGTLAYSYNGDLYVGGKKLPIKLFRDEEEKEIERLNLKNATALAVSPNGKEVAVVIRGDVFVTSVDYATTRRITNTAEQERGVSFSEDGRALYYASERDGCWSIYRTSLTRKEDKYFTYAVAMKNV